MEIKNYERDKMKDLFKEFEQLAILVMRGSTREQLETAMMIGLSCCVSMTSMVKLIEQASKEKDFEDIGKTCNAMYYILGSAFSMILTADKIESYECKKASDTCFAMIKDFMKGIPSI